MNVNDVAMKEWLTESYPRYIESGALMLRAVLDPQGKQNINLYKTRFLDVLTPRITEIFKAMRESIDAGLDMCIVNGPYTQPPFPLELYSNLENAISNIFRQTFKVSVDQSPALRKMYELNGSGVNFKDMTEEQVGFKGLAELRIRWQSSQREFIQKRLDVKHLKEIEKAAIEEAAAKEKTRAEAEKRAKDDELANYQRHISDYRKKQAVAQAGSVKVGSQQGTVVASVDQLLDSVVSIRDELRVLQRTQSMLTSEKASTVNVEKSIAELRKRLAATVAVLNDAVNTGK